MVRSLRRLAAVAGASCLAGAGCTDPLRPCAPDSVCVVAGTGTAGFNGDGLDARDTQVYLPTSLREVDGELHFVDYNNNRIRAVGVDGVVRTVFGNGEHAYARAGALALDSPIQNPADAVLGPDGLLYIAAQHEGRILRVDGGGRVEVVAGTGDIGHSGDGGPATAARMNEPTALVFDGTGRLFVADAAEGRVRVIGLDGGITTAAGTGKPGTFLAGPGPEVPLAQPQGLAFDEPGGRLLIVDTLGHLVCSLDLATGIVSAFAGRGVAGYGGDGALATTASLDSPRSALVTPGGAVIIADAGNNVVRAVEADGTIRTVVGSGQAAREPPHGNFDPGDVALASPSGLLLSSWGDLYISDWGMEAILVWESPLDLPR